MIGASAPRRDGWEKVTGAARYPADIQPDAVLHSRVVFTDQPHARLLRLDTVAAEAVPGVVAVLTSADVPVNEYGLTMFDQPVLIGTASTGRSAIPCDISRWEADHLAVVVAETRAAADIGAAALVCEWEQLPIVCDIDEALRNEVIVRPEIRADSNIYWSYSLARGDVDDAMNTADVVVEATYEVPYQEHAYLQPEAAVSYVDGDGRITVEIAGQWTHEDQEQIAHALDLERDRIRVIYPAIGGAFGGREDMSLQIVMALAAMRLSERGEHRPIRCQWSREESIVGHHKRHRGRIRATWGATRDGRVVAARAVAWLDAGPYNYTSNKVLGNLHMSVFGPYEIPNIQADSHAVFTNAVPGGAFRGFGAPQGAFAAECQMNKLAEALGLDPVEMRRINGFREGSIGHTGTVMPTGVSLPTVIDRCAAAAHWDSPPAEVQAFSALSSLPAEQGAIRRGRGFAVAYKNVGFSFGFPERCEAKVVLTGDDEVDGGELYFAGAEVGQGGHTIYAQMAAEALGLALDQVSCIYSDTATTGDSGSASASRLTFMSGHAIAGSADAALKAWVDGDRPAVGFFRYEPPPTDPIDNEGSQGVVPNFAYSYGAQAIDLSVDIETGHIVVHDAVHAVDVGRMMNPDLVCGQIEGGIVQAHGYAITEDLVVRDARIVNPRLSTYLMPGIGDIPEKVTCVVVEEADPLGPWGARGMAEMPMIPYAAAVVAALHDATGVWFDAYPLTPDRVVDRLRSERRTMVGNADMG